MSVLKFFRFNYFTRLWASVAYPSSVSGCSKLYFFLDGICAGILHGCNVTGYVKDGLWRIKEFDRKWEVTPLRNNRAIAYFNNPDFVHFLLNKKDFNTHFSAVVQRDWISMDNITQEQFRSFLLKHDSVFVKPIEGMQGIGVKKIQVIELSKSDIETLYCELKIGKFLVEQAIKQHSQMNFGGNSVNTVRLYTLLDKSGEVHLLKAILRAGVGSSDVDNFHEGGVIYEVDLNTGIICSKGRNMMSLEANIMIQPNTNIVMLGRQLPNWDLLKTKAKIAAKLIPQCRYVGWDIAITAEGVEFIEGNHNPDHVLLNTPGSRCHWSEFLKYW